MFYHDFGKISQFSYFSGINPALAENPTFYILMFQGPKRRPIDLKIYEDHFLEGRKCRSEGGEKVEARRTKEVGPCGQNPWKVWGPSTWPSRLRCRRSSSPWLRPDLKPTIKIVPQGDPQGGGGETQKPRNRRQKAAVGEDRREGNAAGITSGRLLHPSSGVSINTTVKTSTITIFVIHFIPLIV